METAIITLIWLAGSLVGYFVGRHYAQKDIGAYTVGDRILNIAMSLMVSWIYVLASIVAHFIMEYEDKDAKW